MSDPIPDDGAPRLAARMRALRSSAVRDLLDDARRPGMLSLAGGLPAPEWFDLDGLRAASERVFAQGGRAALQYGATEGQASLRDRLRERLAGRGVQAESDELLVTTGSQQAIDLVARAVLDEGDRVGVEAPSYLAALQVFAACGARFETTDGDEQGARVARWIGAASPPKVVYLVGQFANPTGATLAVDRRIALLRWAAERRVLLIEDDPYGELRLTGEAPPTLYELARQVPGAEPCCVYLSSLSKTVAPGLRLGFALAPGWLRPALVRLKQAADLHTGTLAQEIAAEYLASGRLDGHLARVRAAYGERLRALVDGLRRAFGEHLRFALPQGGMFVWGEFADDTDTVALLARARELGVIFVPGTAFDPAGRASRCLRLSFVTHSPPELARAVDRLADAHRRLARERRGLARA